MIQDHSTSIGFILISILVYYSIRKSKQRNIFNKAIKKILCNSRYNFNYTAKIENELKAYTNLQIIKNGFLNHFIISGSHKGESFTYFQIFSRLNPYSVLIFDTEKYNPTFDYIRITPQTLFNSATDYDLEWIKFNKNFVNKFNNPREALEIVTPSFMELLMDLKNKYSFIDIQYFTDTDYQKESLVLIKKEYIFPISGFKEVGLNDYFKNFLEYVDKGINLKKSI